MKIKVAFDIIRISYEYIIIMSKQNPGERYGQSMEHVLYADILFFINFSMDFITLYLTSRLTSGPPTGIRCAVAAVLGGIYGTAATAAGLDGSTGVLFTGAVSVAMVALAFGFGSFALLLRRAAVFWGLAALLGGVMTAICSLGGDFGVSGKPAGIAALLFAGSTVCLLLVKLLQRFSKRKSVRIKVEFEGKFTEFSALCDSGNLVRDPLSSRPVILADKSVFRQSLPELYGSADGIPEMLAKRLRMIPVKGIGTAELLTGFVPDSVSIVTERGERICDAVIAVTDSGGEFFGGYPANLPASIL